MAYAPPPGTSSLPARLPEPVSISPSGGGGGGGGGGRTGFKPAFGTSAAPQLRPQPFAPSTPPASSTSSPYPPGSTGSTAYSGGTSFANGFAPPGQYSQRSQYDPSATYPSSAYSGYAASAAGVSSTSSNFAYNAPQPLHQQHQPYHHHHQQQQQHQEGDYSHQATAFGPPSYAAPQIQNPFLAPSAAAGAFNASEAAQIAEWQSAYNNTPALGKDGNPIATVIEPPKPEIPAAANMDKKKTVVRQGGGKKWTDDTLLEWDPSHLRLFVGNLAGETTDESLFKAFGRWKSVQKARVIRDKRTTKSKGYGFVSFSDADDFFQAAKEMNGKYIQSHPVVIRKANTDIKVTNVKEKGKGGGGKSNNGSASSGTNTNKNKNKSGLQRGGAHDAGLGLVPGGGVTKPGQKTKNGLRLLG